MRVGDVMQRKVITVNPETSVRDAYAIMIAGGFRHLPVLDARDKLVGILSERDLRTVGETFANPETGRDEFYVTRDVSVSTIMVTEPICVPPHTSIPRASRIIRDERIGCLLVTDGDRLVGILSYLDILDAAVDEQEAPRPRARAREPDETQPLPVAELESLRHQLQEELSQYRLEHPTAPESPRPTGKPASYITASKEKRAEIDRQIAEDNARLIDEITAQLKSNDC